MKSMGLLKYISTIWILILVSCNGRDNGNQQEIANNDLEIHPNKITIATAANMQFAMEELTAEFTKQTGVECELVISSSGKLTAQIKEGAPYDVFVAANMKYPNEIENSGFAANTPKVYAHGRLVLWTMVEGLKPSLDILTSKEIEHIALANPKTAPYGIAAEEVLKFYNLYDKIKDKFVFGESISQTNQFITSQSAEVGFTAMSVVLSPEMKGKGKWMEIAKNAYAPIDQGVVVIKNESGLNQSAIRFYDFLSSDEAKDILTKFGYAVHE